MESLKAEITGCNPGSSSCIQMAQSKTEMLWPQRIWRRNTYVIYVRTCTLSRPFTFFPEESSIFFASSRILFEWERRPCSVLRGCKYGPHLFGLFSLLFSLHPILAWKATEVSKAGYIQGRCYSAMTSCGKNRSIISRSSSFQKKGRRTLKKSFCRKLSFLLATAEQIFSSGKI